MVRLLSKEVFPPHPASPPEGSGAGMPDAEIMAQPFNPFEHHHSHHDHDHDHDEVIEEQLDPAQASLRDALRVSFVFLKIVMLGLLIYYAFSNFRTVSQGQEVAVKLRFGNLVGDTPEAQVVTEGVCVALPYPIEQVREIDIKQKQLSIDKAFFFEVPEGSTVEKMMQNPSQQLNPERDGYVVTGDAGIVHLKLTVQYNVGRRAGEAVSPQRVVQWLKRVGQQETEEQLIRLAVDRGVVHYAASHSADGMVDGWNDNERDQLRDMIQQTLDEMESGLVLGSVIVDQTVVPTAVMTAFQSVVTAENDRRIAIDNAKGARSEKLLKAAGPAHERVWSLIKRYEDARERSDAEAPALEAKLAAALDNLKMPEDEGGQVISGEVATAINAARTYQTQITQLWKNEKERFESLLASYRVAPQFTVTRLQEEFRQKVLGGKTRIFYVPPGKSVIQYGPDQRQQKKWDEEELRATQPGAPATQ